MATSHETFEEETRQLALLVQGEPRPAQSRPHPPRRRFTAPTGFVQAWAWWRRPGAGAARP